MESNRPTVTMKLLPFGRETIINCTFPFSACRISAPTAILSLNRTQKKGFWGMQTLNAIRTIAVCIFCLYVFAENQIVKHLLRKPFFFKFMRVFWVLLFVTLLFFSCIGLFTIFDYARRLFETHELNISELSKLIPHLCVVVLSIFCWRYFWYYLRNDEDTILSGWYIKRHFNLYKRRKFEESYRCLQEASEIKPDSLPVWCLLASFAQLFLEQPEQADQYLAKARKILDSKPIENPKEIAAVEFWFGRISQYRADHKTAIEHMKKACELDPTRFRKEKYEEALELAKEENSSAGQRSE